MNTNNYLYELISDKSDYVLTEEDKKTIQFEGIQKYIYNKLNSNKFKATKTSEDYDKNVKEKIDYCVNQDIPIHIDLSTGATKNPNAPTAPGIDWAEVFNIAFIREYLKPIAVAYKNGVVLEYFSVSVFEEKVNHIPQKDVDLYDKQFTELINFYQNILPANFKLKFSRLSDRGPKEKIYSLMDEKITRLRNDWKNLEEKVKKEKLFRAERNIQFKGDEKNRDEIILTSALSHDAFSSECWAEAASPIWNELDDISLGHRYTAGWAIHVRSGPGSTVNYWSGTGVLFKKGDKYIPNILSPKQYKELENELNRKDVSVFADNPILSQKLSFIYIYYQ